MRRRLLALLAVLPWLPRMAAGQEIRARQNIEYRLIAPQPVATGDRIEVIDFFWYACPYCNALQPALESWIRRKPEDVSLRRIPAVMRDSWEPHARIFYTLESLGELQRLHQAVYRGFHVEKLYLSRPEIVEEWAVRHGIDRDHWRDAYASPEVDAGVESARNFTRRYEVQGTPSIVVDGRYLTSTSMTPTVSAVVEVMEDLIRLARQNRAR